MLAANAQVIADTAIRLAQFALIAYGFHLLAPVLHHWLDAHGGVVLERRTPEEIAVDEERSRV